MNLNISIANKFHVMVMMLVPGQHLESHSPSQLAFKALVLNLGFVAESPGEP